MARPTKFRVGQIVGYKGAPGVRLKILRILLNESTFGGVTIAVVKDVVTGYVTDEHVMMLRKVK